MAKRLALIVLLCTMGVGRIVAGTDYAIWFKNCGDDTHYDTKVTTKTGLIDSGGEFLTGIQETTAINTYRSQKTLGFGLRLGTFNATGSLTMTLVTPMPASKIALNVAHYYDEVRKKSDTGGVRLTATYTDGTTTINNITIATSATGEKGHETDHHVVRLVPEKTLQKVTLASINSDYGRVYCKNLTIYSAPIVTNPTATNITKTDATITSKVTDLGSVLTTINKGYGFVISSTNTVPTKSDCEKSIRVGEKYTTLNHPFSIDLTDLTPGTTYYTRAYVSKNDTENGWDSYSALTTTFNTIGHRATFNVGEEGYGSCEITSLEEFPNTAGITLPTVTVEPNCGYRFLGWATTSGATTADAGNAGDIYNLESDMIFYAVYIQQFTVQWLIDGQPTNENSPTTIVDKGSKVTHLPTSPNQEEDCRQVFMGWTNAPITATQTNPPTILFTTTNASPNIYENTTFYAVFADIKQ